MVRDPVRSFPDDLVPTRGTEKVKSERRRRKVYRVAGRSPEWGMDREIWERGRGCIDVTNY